MVILVNNNKININGHLIILNRKIIKAIEIDNGFVLVLIDIPIGDDGLNNLFSYTKNGEFLWQIEPSNLQKEGQTSYPYEGLNVVEGQYFVVDFYGRRIFFDPYTGLFLSRDIVK
ncbi:hypothetical protein GPY51_23980 [Photorhabdus laumondii subsp. laumondii]|uniref:Photorhabdus luminescens subsp. laumondii TTO1 complete genome segment 5/17 n=2 Tax=Photorhabdus laumondii subsp. laumondii TaxID=141679 RepID=Q7N724_PHOLL|nr:MULTISPECIES: hypothetical protein [Photorhabdus]AWK41220.1 hypothetical protein A4R40_06725 [Photorhabdus laumondii subsp. laumondii]AXG41953.1 hypothetical protein PluDJC_06500 [Photorhabdus laumondii subsp. laumondii]AXG46544.1 hypothetical protein PluTT01m_06920 [Photorhabdus laumondii subsp. laumondii]MCC8386446.1 hypothetical protein [Photorhabdus laumondii]MCC8390704.1 hypothetical protein [Photorhabdus laumondii]